MSSPSPSYRNSPRHSTSARAHPDTPPASERRPPTPSSQHAPSTPMSEQAAVRPSSYRPPRHPPRSSRPSRAPPRRPRTPRASPYIPPFRQARLDATSPVTPLPASAVGQERAWLAAKKRVNGSLNRISADNVAAIAKALLRLNLIRLRGVFAKAIMRAQLASPAMSPVFACLVAVIGTRLPVVAELVVNRLVAQMKAAYENQDRVLCFATVRFFAQLFNQQVVTDVLILQILSTCMLNPTDGSVELAVVTLRDCAVLLSEKAPELVEIAFQRLRNALHEGDLSRRVQVLIEDLMIQRRKGLSNGRILEPALDLIDDEDIITHLTSLEDDEELDVQYDCNNFQPDPDFERNEEEYEQIKRDILGIEADETTDLIPGLSNNESDSHVHASPNEATSQLQRNLTTPEKITDMTDADLVDFRRTIYLTISSGLSYEEWAHKLLLLMRSHPGKEPHLCQMIVECCSQEKTFLHSYGLLAQRFCLLNGVYASNFEQLFATHYATIHRLDTPKIRNIAFLFASLLASDALSWSLFELVRIVEDETTSSSRIFLMNLFQEVYKTLGERGMREKVSAAEQEGHMKGVFPTDTADNARFSINFFTKIELGFLTDGLRAKLRSLPSNAVQQVDDEDEASSSSLSSSSLSSSSLSPSSNEGQDDREETSQQVEGSAGGKRDQSESSIAPSDRPSKSRRRFSKFDGRKVDRAERPSDDDYSRDNRHYGSRSRVRDSPQRSQDVGHASSSSGARRVSARRVDRRDRDRESSDDEYGRSRRSSDRYYRRRRRKSSSRRRSRRSYSDSDSDEERRGRGRRYRSDSSEE